MTPIPFRSTAVGNTAVAIQAVPGKIYGYNIINPNSAHIFVKFYDKAAAGVNPASDSPKYTIFIPGSGSEKVRGMDLPFDFTTAISVRSCTGSADTDTTAPATLPIIEVDYYFNL